ncbi:MAG: OmpA family protein [Opitutae bacterium]|nr:OmpA family protein [Opitutae bacterium]
MARKKEAAHHGGAWKVAYADFVTAMMALFMVLWISAQDKKILLSTSRYFQNPFSSPISKSSGVMPFEKSSTTKENNQSMEQPEDTGKKPNDSQKQIELAFLNSAAKEFMKLLNIDDADKNQAIDVQVTSDGLRITLFDRARRPLFKDNTAAFTEWGRFVMQNVAWLIERHRFSVIIEGHTRSKLEFPDPEYTAWELSAERANASRRALTRYAVDAGSIERVSGYADTRPVAGEDPASESNQRVALSLNVGKKPAKPGPLPADSLKPTPRVSSHP